MLHFDWIKRHAERTPDKLALIDLASGRQFTYAQFNERANRLASFLMDKLGLRKGDRVSILAKNSTDYYEVVIACGKAGIILNTLNWRLAPPELEYIIDDCTPRALIYEPDFQAAVDALRTKIGVEFYVKRAETAPDGEWTYEGALATGDPAGVEMPMLKYEDTWCILYTAGTTGRSKGAQVTYGNFLFNAVGMGRALDLTSQDVNLTMLPTFHAGGLGLYAGPIFHAGGTLVVMRDFDPADMLRQIEKRKVTVIILVPPMYLMLKDHPEFGQHDLSSMRCWTSGGSPLPPSLVQAYAEHGIIIQQGFGMTETGPTVFLVPKADAVRKAGSVGKPVLHTDVCIMDRKLNKLGPNEVGELCIRGNITSGYWKQPEKTAEAIIDGWLHSGDAARYDEEGFYYIVDRWKDMYISGGENVYPAEVEAVLYQMPAIAEVAVIGVPDPKWQEVGKAVVAVKEGHTLSQQELLDFCQGRLARYKIPKSVAFVDRLPRNDIGKVMKTTLREMFGGITIAR
jgi:fatty-acyl-CoA synthase